VPALKSKGKGCRFV